MEHLKTAIFEKYFTDDPEKQFFLCSCASWESLGRSVEPSSKHFGLLVAGDAKSISDDGLTRIANELEEKGLGYLCAWGPDCGRVEDVFDEVYVERELDGKAQTGRDDTLMTTSHAQEPFSDAIWFFAHCAWPTKYFAVDCKDWIVAVVGNNELEHYMRNSITEILSRDEN